MTMEFVVILVVSAFVCVCVCFLVAGKQGGGKKEMLMFTEIVAWVMRNSSHAKVARGHNRSTSSSLNSVSM